ncbi:MAG: DUF6785 family protein [Kiritimatiellia bacterium]
MSLRAVILGLLSAAFVCSYTYFNDHIMRQTMFVGNSMPISVYGLLVIFLLFIFPLLRKIHRKLALRQAELAVILAMTLAVCAIPGSNLLRIFSPTLVLPHRFENTEPGWQKQEVMDLVPEGMLVDVKGREELVLNGFARGLREGNQPIAVSEVPWKAWARPILFWVPIILSLWIAMVGLSLVVHRQWVDYEHLPYPIVTFTKSLLPNDDGTPNPIFSNRIFWIGLLTAFLIHSYNYLVVWFPDYLFGEIPLGVDFSSLTELFPTFEKGGGENFLSGYHTMFFTVIAVAYFLPKDVSLSMGLGPFLWVGVAGALATYGIGTSGWQGAWPFGIQRDAMVIMGAYLAMLLVLIYTGRHYFSNVFKRAAGFKTADKIEPSAVWGARVFIAAMFFFVVYSAITAKLDWPLALLLGLGLAAIYLVMGRMIAETGLFFIVVTGTPATIIWAVFGAKALGPQMMLIMFMFCTMLFYDTREALMPYIVNAIKLTDDCKVKMGKTALIIIAALMLGLAVGIPVTLYFQYDLGIDISAWQNNQPKVPFNEVIGAMQRLDAQGQLETAGLRTGFARVLDMAPHWQGLLTMGLSIVLVLVFSFLRLRFARWPLHPVMFLIWSTYAGNCFAQSFLIGWLIKVAVTKYGGANIYQKLKPLMFGLIAGEMLGGVLPMIVSLIYYKILTDGLIPKAYQIMPG